LITKSGEEITLTKSDLALSSHPSKDKPTWRGKLKLHLRALLSWDTWTSVNDVFTGALLRTPSDHECQAIAVQIAAEHLASMPRSEYMQKNVIVAAVHTIQFLAAL
jgi:hypothetical protein